MTGMDNLTAVLYDVNDLRMEMWPIPEIGDNEVLLKMAKVGICGSDVSYLTKGRIGHFVLTSPMVIGHEAAGVVAKCGAAVRHLKEGDRVAIEPGVPCRICHFCKIGKYNLCPDISFCATPPVHGNLCRYYKHAADFCFKLPEHVTLEEGALLEPLSVGVHACRRAEITLGSKVLICGAGPIGLVCLLTAKALGASYICITDIVEDRLRLAKELGANTTVNVCDKTTEAVAAEITSEMGDEYPDKTIDCCGAESTIRLGLLVTKSGGILVLVGHGPPEVKIPLVSAAIREVDIRGVFRYVNCYQAALDLISSGNVDAKSLITHRFKLEDTLQAFNVARTGEGGAIKVMISC